MTDLLQRFSNGQLLALIAIIGGLYLPILGGVTVAITKVIAVHFRRIRQDDMEVRLKLEMILRDMSADEISQILEIRLPALSPLNVEMSSRGTHE